MTDVAQILKLAADPNALDDDQRDRVLREAFSCFDAIAASAAPTDADVRDMAALSGAVRMVRAAQEGRPPQVPAGGPRAGRMAARTGRPSPSPAPAPDRRTVSITAATGSSKVLAGQPLTDTDELAGLMHEILTENLAPDGSDHPRRALVARARWEYPDTRKLTLDGIRNGQLINAVCSAQAVTASGGVCLPVNVDYSVPTWAEATRPLRDALPAFQADRGGLRFVQPPDVGQVSLQHTPPSGLGAATGVWTEATDANPAGATKPVYVVQCGSEQLVYVNAIPTRLQFGNLQGRFAPEQMAANTNVAIAAAAREQELKLLTLMYAKSKQVKAPTTPYLGAARDIMAAVDLLSEKYRYSHRIPHSSELTAVFPAWARGLMRADLVRELAHDNTAPGRDVFAVADAVIQDWFGVRNINLIWSLDGLPAGTYGTGGSAIAAQFFPVLGTSATVAAWPNVTSGKVQVAWLLYAEGSYQYLDGGRLTLGVVRDSTLDATNDFETFVEVFEGVAFRGIEAYQVQSTVEPTGGSAATISSGYRE